MYWWLGDPWSQATMFSYSTYGGDRTIMGLTSPMHWPMDEFMAEWAIRNRAQLKEVGHGVTAFKGILGPLCFPSPPSNSWPPWSNFPLYHSCHRDVLPQLRPRVMEPVDHELKLPKPWAKIKLPSLMLTFSLFCHSSEKLTYPWRLSSFPSLLLPQTLISSHNLWCICLCVS